MNTMFIFKAIMSLLREPKFDNASYFVSYNLLAELSILLPFFFFLGAAATDLYKMAF